MHIVKRIQVVKFVDAHERKKRKKANEILFTIYYFVVLGDDPPL